MKKFKKIRAAVCRFMRMVLVWAAGLLPLVLTAFLLRRHGIGVALLAGCGSEAIVSLIITWLYAIAGRAARRHRTNNRES